jgi:Adenosine specific kinase
MRFQAKCRETQTRRPYFFTTGISISFDIGSARVFCWSSFVIFRLRETLPRKQGVEPKMTREIKQAELLGQTHFIKSVEDIHEALVGAVPGIQFGLAFSEASGKPLVRWSGTDAGMVELAIGAGHTFIIFLGDGFYPLNVLNTLPITKGLRHSIRANTLVVMLLLLLK